MSSPAEVYDAILDETHELVVGNEDIIEGLTISLLTNGHVLIEGVPGVAKTTIANVFARATGMSYNRIQMTPDMVPADITGTNVYRQGSGEFLLRKGPVFSNLVLADEINRATPKTQSALLEAMEERTVTIDGETLDLPRPFMVIATQNPIEMEGVFELPEAQRDRFQVKFLVDIPERSAEREILDRFDEDPEIDPDVVEQVVTPDDISEAREQVSNVFVAEPVKEYILDIVAATRESVDLRHGGSPRATLAFLATGKARAALHNRDYVIPDDVKTLAGAVLRHRVIRSTDAELSSRETEEIIENVLETVSPPSADASYAQDETPSPQQAADGGRSPDNSD